MSFRDIVGQGLEGWGLPAPPDVLDRLEKFLKG